MSRLACVLLVAAMSTLPLLAQKKPEPKPESAPASQPTIAIDPELQKEIDAINTAMSVKLNCVAGKNFDLVGTINPTQLQLLMEVADRTFKIFEEVTAGSGGVAGASATGNGSASGAPAGKTPAEALFGGRKCLVAVFNNGTQYQAFGKWYDEYYKFPYNFADMKTRTYFPYAWPRSCIATHLKPHDMNMLRNVIAHEIGHVCGYRFAYNNADSPIWFVEGLATCLEGRATGTTNCYCFSGGYGDANASAKTLVNREWAKWKAQVKTQVKAKQEKTTEALLRMKLNEMTMNDVGKAMAVVDYWMKNEPAKLTQWIAATKKHWPQPFQADWSPAKGEAQKRALKEVFGMEWPELDEAVRKHVQASY